MRINQSSKATWMPPHPIGVVQGSAAVVKVLASAHADFAVGDFALAHTGWQTHAKVHASALSKLNPAQAPVQTALGVLGMPGRTAWFGFTEALQPKLGQVLVVSGAAGAVGSLVVQFARLAGVRVLAIAGSVEKCAWLKTIGAEWAINYKDFASADALQTAIFACCGGVDMYFDNVGGMVSDAVFPLINKRARIVICGQISQYSNGLDTPLPGPRFLHHVLYQRATIQGILARDWLHRVDEFQAAVAPLIAARKLTFAEHVVEGFMQLPNALSQMFNGQHTGKVLVKV